MSEELTVVFVGDWEIQAWMNSGFIYGSVTFPDSELTLKATLWPNNMIEWYDNHKHMDIHIPKKVKDRFRRLMKEVRDES